jgi:hypothetical protein
MSQQAQTPHDKILDAALELANTQIAELYPHNSRAAILPKQRVYEALVHVAYELGMSLVNPPQKTDCEECGNTRACQHCSGSGHDPDGGYDADRIGRDPCPLCKGSGACPYCREEGEG